MVFRWSNVSIEPTNIRSDWRYWKQARTRWFDWRSSSGFVGGRRVEIENFNTYFIKSESTCNWCGYKQRKRSRRLLQYGDKKNNLIHVSPSVEVTNPITVMDSEHHLPIEDSEFPAHGKAEQHWVNWTSREYYLSALMVTTHHGVIINRCKHTNFSVHDTRAFPVHSFSAVISSNQNRTLWWKSTQMERLE